MSRRHQHQSQRRALPPRPWPGKKLPPASTEMMPSWLRSWPRGMLTLKMHPRLRRRQ
jgi:hypothetical protein